MEGHDSMNKVHPMDISHYGNDSGGMMHKMMHARSIFNYHTPMTSMLFIDWTLSTITGLVLAMIATFVFAISYEGLRYYVYVHGALQKRGEKWDIKPKKGFEKLPSEFCYLVKRYLISLKICECTDKHFYELTATNTEQFVVSPNFPAYYPKNVKCGFRIKSPENHVRVHLDVTRAAVGNPAVCGLDALYIYDGPSDKSRLLGKVCYNIGSYVSTNEYMFLEFSSYSNDQTRGVGFRAKYYSEAKPIAKSEEFNYIGLIIGLSLLAVVIICVIHCFLYKRYRIGKVQWNWFKPYCLCCKIKIPQPWQPPPIEIENEDPSAPSTPDSAQNYVSIGNGPPPYVPSGDPFEPPPSYEEVMANIHRQMAPTSNRPETTSI
ncbi:hypothetical protein LOTGIDRAFT_234404 [Lottia gigantea]|uniref:CUB domain-containing protein n=1 Tax=Lottia gigantea TaxID=225164 RepID=V3ZWP0_LOTGI|nr:hypothetical protein LOTGIDRAFT_234404 [Lottia gigantea]ESO88817.1 hypothetical protein LOTGIDRAFT_234404 [Lottia gigantea]